ncbi:DUF6941 family protein [Fodinicurvata fenggangensis]|uniref:DUF6941 family protein n=1 Tax=Fodinicurvata fenggangensis TaxID=1121830 RepID=UPI000478D01E|nr:hypothetical protein [Fodinicurvata fenggangensis]
MSIHGYVLFCDDIRQEVSRKHTYVGVYTGAMTVQRELPYTLPQLCMVIDLVFEREPVPDKIHMTFTFPGGEETSGVVDVGLDPKDLKTIEGDSDKVKQFTVSQQIVFEGAVISQEGQLKVTAQIEDNVIEVGKLEVRVDKMHKT